MRPLTPATCTIHHRGLGWAPVDDEGATATCGSISKREAGQVHILVEAIAVAESIGSRGGGTLGEDDDEARKGDGQNHRYVAVGDVRKAQVQKAAGHAANNLGFSMEIGAGRGQADDGEQSARKTRGKVFESDDDRQDRQGDIQTRQTRVSQVLESEEELAEEAVASLLDAEHSVKFTAGYLLANSRQKAVRLRQACVGSDQEGSRLAAQRSCPKNRRTPISVHRSTFACPAWVGIRCPQVKHS